VAERLAEHSAQTPPTDGLLDEPEMAALMGASPQTLMRARVNGDVPCVRLGRLVRYEPAKVLAALSERGPTPGGHPTDGPEHISSVLRRCGAVPGRESA
jgi:hypothetical protein